MKTVLLIESDKDIRDALTEFADTNPASGYSLRALRSLEESEGVLRREVFHALILDAIEPSRNQLLDFIRQVRRRDFQLPILVLLDYSDIIVGAELREVLLKEKVSIANKSEMLHPKNLPRLLPLACDHGLGESL